MNIDFTARHFHVPDSVKDYAIEEVSKLKKYNSRAIKCQVILMHENNQFTTELNLSIPRKKLNVKDTTDNLTKSIDRAVKKMIQRISRLKTKKRTIN